MDFEVYPVRSSRPRPSHPHDIPIRVGAEDIGYLCLLRGVRGEVSALTEAQAAAMMYEMRGSQLLEATYSFGSDYVVVRSGFVGEYAAVRESSPFWGQYLHEADAPADSLEVFREDEVIRVDGTYAVPTPRHAESLSKYASYGRPTDRFLFLYHFLELDFDREVVNRIKALTDDNLNGVGKIIKDLGGGDEFNRLTHIIREMPVDPIQDSAGVLRDHAGVCHDLFYEYGKDSNPVKSYEDFQAYFVRTPAVREHIFREHKAKEKISTDLTKDYSASLRKCAAYWIYRVRCCVAHNKLGEYHLMSIADMKFLEGFAIPLLRSIVKYRMSC